MGMGSETSAVGHMVQEPEASKSSSDFIPSLVTHKTNDSQLYKNISSVAHKKDNDNVIESVTKTTTNDFELPKDGKPEIKSKAKNKKDNNDIVESVTKATKKGNIKPELTSKTKNILGTKVLGTLYLTLHKAKDLEDKDLVGKSDPFATIKYGDTRFKSTTKENTCNPEWNFEVDFKIHENYPKDIKIELFDKDKVGKDDPLGETILNVQEIMEKASVTNFWTTLDNSKKGQILYTAKFSPTDEKVRKKSSVITSHSVPITTEGSIENLLISHNIQLPEGFSVESINSEQNVSHEIVPENKPISDYGAIEVITLDKDEHKSKLNRHITITDLHHNTAQSASTESTQKTTQNLSSVGKKVKEISEPNKETTESASMPNVEPGTSEVLHIRVHKARNLENKDKHGKSDPYIILNFGEHEVKSRTINDNLNPEWQFFTKFNISSESPNSVSIRVIDKDIGKDENLGMIELDVSEIKSKKQVLQKWMPLKHCKSGEIQISGQYIVGDSKNYVKMPKSGGVNALDKYLREDSDKSKDLNKTLIQRGNIKLMIKQARDLKKSKVGKADPYVTLRLGKQIFRSETIKNNQNPEWNFSQDFKIYDNYPEYITLETFDQDIGRDDFLGNFKFDIAEIIKFKKIESKWVPLQKCKTGEILVSAEYISLEEIPTELSQRTFFKEEKRESETATQSVIVSTEKQDSAFEPGEISLAIHKARNLEKKGFMGKPDPYVSVRFGKQQFRSKTIKNNYDPELDFNVKLEVNELVDHLVFVEVLDDDIGKDDKLGKTSFEIHELLDKEGIVNQWVPLDNCKSGEVLISASFIPREINEPVQKSKDSNISISSTNQTEL